MEFTFELTDIKTIANSFLKLTKKYNIILLFLLLHPELFSGVLVRYKYETFVKRTRTVCSSTL